MRLMGSQPTKTRLFFGVEQKTPAIKLQYDKNLKVHRIAFISSENKRHRLLSDDTISY